MSGGLLWPMLGLAVALLVSVKRLLRSLVDPVGANLAYTIDACPDCREEVAFLPPDGLAYCPDCERCCEGSTIELTIME